jgi:hypothetical protein
MPVACCDDRRFEAAQYWAADKQTAERVNNPLQVGNLPHIRRQIRQSWHWI